jgi:hypothetical protein
MQFGDDRTIGGDLGLCTDAKQASGLMGLAAAIDSSQQLGATT